MIARGSLAALLTVLLVLAFATCWETRSLVLGEGGDPARPVSLLQDDDDEQDEEEAEESEDEQEPPRWYGRWNLGLLDERYHHVARALEHQRYEESLRLLKEVKAAARKQRLTGEKKKIKFLERVTKELLSARQLAARKKPSHRDLETVRSLAYKYRDTFAYLPFMEHEYALKKKSVFIISDFEPSPDEYAPMTSPIEFFSTWKARVQSHRLADRVTSEAKHVRQGRHALHWDDTGENRRLGWLISPQELDWSDYRYLCFNIKITDHTVGRIMIFIYADEQHENYWKLACGNFKGWKQLRFKFKKEAGAHRSNPHRKMSWKNVHGVLFGVDGGSTDFYLDDVHLCN